MPVWSHQARLASVGLSGLSAFLSLNVSLVVTTFDKLSMANHTELSKAFEPLSV